MDCREGRGDCPAESIEVAGFGVSAVKSNAVSKHIPVVILSGEGMEEETRRCLEAGAASYIKKPFGDRELLAVIQRLGAVNHRHRGRVHLV